jgi:plastocyanin
MKANTFILMLLLTVTGLKAQSSHKIQQIGFTFSPSTLTIEAGENVEFEGSDSHPILEVSQTTWNDDGITPLEGGFSLPTGSGTVNFPEAGTHYYVCTAHVASQGMKGKIIVQIAEALNEVSLSEQYAVFPVPLSGNELTVALKTTGEQKVSIDIYDLAGNLMISSLGETVDNKYQIDCSSLPKGLFLMKMKSDEGISLVKVVRL